MYFEMGFEGIGSCKTLLSDLETASSKVKGGILSSTLKLAVLMSTSDHFAPSVLVLGASSY